MKISLFTPPIVVSLLMGCSLEPDKAHSDPPKLTPPIVESAPLISDLKLDHSISGGNDLTITVGPKTSGQSSILKFRNDSGSYDDVALDAPISVVVSDGSRVGIPNGELNYLYVYVVNNGGTPSVAVSSKRYADNSKQDVYAEGGSGGADGRDLYGLAVLTGVPIRLIGALKIQRSGTGYWQAATDLQLAPLSAARKIQCILTRVAGVWTCLDTNGHRSENVADVVNGSWYATINFPFTAQNVKSIQITPDKIYTAAGITATWAPLATSYATIWFYQGTTQLTSAQADISGANFSVTIEVEE